jgi:ribonucleoside-diphosphate reductase alpha chain
VPAATGVYANGHANGTSGALSDLHVAATVISAPVNMLDAQLGELMGDAPFCDVCGHITVRNGACYKCLNCGNSLGCS